MCSFRIIRARNVKLDVPVYFSKAKHEHTVRKMKKIYKWVQYILISKAVPQHTCGGSGAERMYSSYSFFTSALGGGEWSASRPGRALLPVKGPPVLIVPEFGRALEPVWTQKLDEKFLPLPRIKPGSPGRPDSSQTLYWLSYPGSHILISTGIKFKNKNKFRYGIPAYTGPFSALTTNVTYIELCTYVTTLNSSFGFIKCSCCCVRKI
jgi:hypothetical protein